MYPLVVVIGVLAWIPGVGGWTSYEGPQRTTRGRVGLSRCTPQATTATGVAPRSRSPAPNLHTQCDQIWTIVGIFEEKNLQIIGRGHAEVIRPNGFTMGRYQRFDKPYLHGLLDFIDNNAGDDYG